MRLRAVGLFVAATRAMSSGVPAAAASFVEARLAASLIPSPPALAVLEDGYRAQEEMVASSAGRLGGKVGWKIGATNAGAQAAMGFGPFFGPLFAKFMLSPSSSLSLKSLGSFRANEAEFCLFMREGCPPKTDGSLWTEDDVYARIEAVAPAIEIAATRCSDSPLSAQAVLADFALNGVCVLGAKIPRESIGDKEKLGAAAKASLRLNSVVVASESGANVLTNPVTALTWLSNELNKRNLQLEAGDLIMTGAAAASKQLSAGDVLEAVFVGGGMGEAEKTVSISITE